MIIVGAGAIGATTAYELARRGAQVTVLERGSGVGAGCSYANAGVIAPDHVGPLATPPLVAEGAHQMFTRPPAVRVTPQPSMVPWLAGVLASARPSRSGPAGRMLRELAFDSADRHAAYADAGLSTTYRRTGALEVYLDKTGHGDLDDDKARALAPSLGPVAGAHWSPDEAVVESRAYVTSMLDAARDHGARIRFGVAVRHLTLSDGHVTGVVTADRNLGAGRVVLATGLATPALASDARITLPMRGGRGYVVDLRVDGAPDMPIRLKERRMVVTPFADRLRVCGLMQFGAEHSPLRPGRVEAMLDVLRRALPGVRVHEVMDTWVGERPCTRDGVPVIGASRRAPGLTIAAGHGMWGLILAPVTAELVAAQVLDGKAPQGADRLSPDRFRSGLGGVAGR